MKIILVTSIPSPYRIPLFRRLSDRCHERGWHLKVLFLSRGYSRRQWKVDDRQFQFDHGILHEASIMIGEAFFSMAWKLPIRLHRERPDVVIVAGFGPATLWVALMAFILGTPFIVWSGETIQEEAIRKKFRSLRRVFRRFIARRADAFIAYGSVAKAYLENLGLPTAKIFVATNTVDTETIQTETTRKRATGRNPFGDQAGSRFNILFVGYLEKRKGVHLILEALDQLRGFLPEERFAFHIVGGGREDVTLKNIVALRNLGNVLFWGHHQNDALPAYYAFGDVLIFSSLNELYGLVPIEAMAAGLPVLCSKYAGCTPDLIVSGVNGIIIDPRDPLSVAQELYDLLSNDARRLAMSRAAQETALRRFSIDVSTTGFLEALDFVIASRHRPRP